MRAVYEIIRRWNDIYVLEIGLYDILKLGLIGELTQPGKTKYHLKLTMVKRHRCIYSESIQWYVLIYAAKIYLHQMISITRSRFTLIRPLDQFDPI